MSLLISCTLNIATDVKYIYIFYPTEFLYTPINLTAIVRYSLWRQPPLQINPVSQ